MRTVSIGTAVAKLLAPRVRNVSFDYQQMSVNGRSQAVLSTSGMEMECPHCNATVPANHGHACSFHQGTWTRRNTPL